MVTDSDRNLQLQYHQRAAEIIEIQNGDYNGLNVSFIVLKVYPSEYNRFRCRSRFKCAALSRVERNLIFLK